MGMSREKAKKIIKDGKLHGKSIGDLPDKQRRYIYWIAGGRKRRKGPK